ncbi:adenylate cyclase [Micromonospora globispora]|uniref:adenylate cyclase n=1 Tax=Micromonospora globispora TaxID=1450148 RepID=UPI00163A88D1|nr:adenylate cyclase [Micromonospora globispora]
MSGAALAVGLAASGGAAFAANPPGTGQPFQECGEEGAKMTPGNSASTPGSPFNPDGVAGTVYAGEQPQNSRNPHSVSQYDVACFQVTQNH